MQCIRLERILPPAVHRYISSSHARHQAARDLQAAVIQLERLASLELHDICFARQMITNFPLKTLRYILNFNFDLNSVDC